MVKKAQAKIQQMAFMLIGVVVLFVLVGVFLLTFRLSSLQKSADLLEEKNAMLLVTKLAESPEFSCGEAYGGKRVNCVDFDKVFVLKQRIDTYENFWQISNIELRKLDSEQDIECNLNTYPDCNLLSLYDDSPSGFDYSTYVAICKKQSALNFQQNKCEIGKLIINYDKKL